MTSELIQPAVHRKLLSLRGALRRRLTGEGLAWLLVTAVAIVFLSLALDYLLRLDRLQRQIVMGAALAWICWSLWRGVLRPLRVPMDVASLALLLERKFPQLGDRLISALQFQRTAKAEALSPSASGAMVAAMAAQANAAAAGLDFSAVVERRVLGRTVLTALCAVMLLGGFAVWQRPIMALWVQRDLAFAEVDWPQDTYLEVQGGGDFSVLRGEDLEIVVEATGPVVPPYIIIHADYPSVGRTEEKVDAQGGRFVKKLASVSEEFRFHVTGGDDLRDARRRHHVALIEAPSLREVRFTVEHHPYMNRHRDVLEGGSTDLQVTPGCTLRIEGQSTKDLRSASLVLDGQTLGPMRLGEKKLANRSALRLVAGELSLPPLNASAGKTLQILLEDTEGFTNRRQHPLTLEVLPKHAPVVDIKQRAVGPSVSPKAAIPFTVSLKDDCGLGGADLVLAVKGKVLKAMPIDHVAADATDLHLRPELDLQPFSLSVGDVIQVFAQARDTMPPEFTNPDGSPGPNVSRSNQVEFRIVRPEDLMDELVRRQKEQRLEFVQAIALQEQARAKAAAAAADLTSGKVTPQSRQMLKDSLGLQNSVGAQCGKITQSMAAILDEMRANRLGVEQDLTDMDQKVLSPMKDLGEPIAKACGDITAADSATVAADLAASAERIAAEQQAIRTQMETILQSMQKIGSRQEVEKELQLLIKQSGDLLEQIKQLQVKQQESIFAPTTTTSPAK